MEVGIVFSQDQKFLRIENFRIKNKQSKYIRLYIQRHGCGVGFEPGTPTNKHLSLKNVLKVMDKLNEKVISYLVTIFGNTEHSSFTK